LFQKEILLKKKMHTRVSQFKKATSSSRQLLPGPQRHSSVQKLKSPFSSSPWQSCH